MGGKILKDVLQERDISVSKFVDRNTEIKYVENLPVVSMESLNAKRDYIVISLRGYDFEAVSLCKQYGFMENDIYCLVAGELINSEDIYFRGCKVGRYTYGYETLLEFYPLAKEIGRYCSINPTAKIWNNHPVDYVSTHPFLDHPNFYPWEKQGKREKMILKYGKYFDNVEFENSALRKNQEIIIENDVWIGANVVILPGIRIGNGAIIAAGAVVTHDVEPYAIVGGVPARVIKYRYKKSEIEQFQKIQWWNWKIEKIEENIELFYQPDKFLEIYGKG